MIKKICVYCGSHPGTDPTYTQVAKETGRFLAKEGIGLVYGGGCRGLMGIVADAALAEGGSVIGVIPEALMNVEQGHKQLTRLEVVPNMHVRKEMMMQEADAFIALPGGIGTLEEIFEVFTWHQLGFLEKPFGLLNVNGYYDHLIQFLANTVDKGFLKQANLDYLQVDRDLETLVDRLKGYTRVPVTKW